MASLLKKITTGLTGILLFGTAGPGIARVDDAPGPMMATCAQMMAQVGGMGGMAPQRGTPPLEGREPTEHGKKQADGLEVTLLSAPPLSPDEMQRMMPGMGGMQGMEGMMRGGMRGMEGMMRGSPSSGGKAGMKAQPTHWVGVIVRDVSDDRVVQGLDITLTAQKGAQTRTVKLMPMPGSYGANISLPAKGRYAVAVTIARAQKPLSLSFELDNK